MNDFSPTNVAPAVDPLADDPDKVLAEMNERFAVIKVGGRVRIGLPEHYDPAFDRKHLLIMPVGDFKLELSNRKIWLVDENGKPTPVPLANWWLAHPDRRQYLGGVVCEPGRNFGPDYLNLWQGFTVEPDDAGDPSVILEHLAFLASGSGPAAEEYLINWTARALQSPGLPGDVAVVLRGKKGTAKGAFGHLLHALFGVHAFYASHQRDLAGNFNAHLLNTCFCFADECFFAGNPQHESTLKSLITEPTLRIELKGIDVFQARNHVTLLMASNKDWVVPATADERRFFVLDVPDDHMSNTAYWKRLFAALDNKRAVSAFLYYMLVRDLEDFNHRAVPSTAALDDQKKASFTTEEKWLCDLLARGVALESFQNTSLACVPWQDEIPTDTLFACYEQYYQSHGGARYAMHRVQFGQFLSKYFKKTRPRTPKKSTPRPWCYNFGPLAEARTHFCKIQKVRIDWDEA
jgi:Family of unknown function (DUF5906)